MAKTNIVVKQTTERGIHLMIFNDEILHKTSVSRKCSKSSLRSRSKTNINILIITKKE